MNKEQKIINELFQIISLNTCLLNLSENEQKHYNLMIKHFNIVFKSVFCEVKNE